MGRLEKDGWEQPASSTTLRILLAIVPVAIVGGLGCMALFNWFSSLVSDDGGSTAEARPVAEERRRPELVIDRDYEPGDCITFEATNRGMEDPQVVPCDQPHRMQVTETVGLRPVDGGYPDIYDWAAVIDRECRPAVESLLGRPLDPFGRFIPTALYPSRDNWIAGDRAGIWCGIGWLGPAHGWGDISETTTAPPLFAVDVRSADPGYRHPAGTCLDKNARVTEPIVVDCSQPHTEEVAGGVDLSGKSGPPTGSDLSTLYSECHRQVREYLGGDPEPPWETIYEKIADESWAGGIRWAHCYVAQWEDGAATGTEVAGSARA